MKLQLLLSKLINFRLLGGGTDDKHLSDAGKKEFKEYEESWFYDIINPLVKILDSLLVPIIIILGVAGAIYSIVLGVQYAKAETTDKRDEAKKRLINAVIGVVIMLIVLIAMKIFVHYAPEIAAWINSESGTTE